MHHGLLAELRLLVDTKNRNGETVCFDNCQRLNGVHIGNFVALLHFSLQYNGVTVLVQMNI